MSDDLTMECATKAMDTFHMMMRTIGGEMRKRSPKDLSIQQFRALMTIKHHEGASLSLVSDHLGATLSAASKLVDGLVDRGLVRRDTAEEDRRKLTLALSEVGEELVETMHRERLAFLAERLSKLSPSECAMVNLSMELLKSAFGQGQFAPIKQKNNVQVSEI